MKFLMSALLPAILIFSTAGAQAQERTLRILNDGEYPPFSNTSVNGTMFGFDIDITKALCSAMKVKCEFVRVEFDKMILELKSHKADAIIASMNSNAERKKEVLFTVPYYQNPGRFVCKKGASKDLKDKTLGVLRGSIFDTYASSKLKDLPLKRYNSQTDAYFNLRAKRIDLLFADSLVLENDFLKRPEGRHFELCMDPLNDPQYFGEGIAIAVRLDDKKLADEFNAAIKAIRDSGEYQRISKQYFDRDIYENSSTTSTKN